MYILITYDVSTSTEGGQKRLRKVAKICENYGQRVQNSVFECLVSPAQKIQIQAQLLDAIDQENDSLRIYHLGNNYASKIEKLGKQKDYDIEGELII